MSYRISSCKTVILYFIIYCIFISFYSSVKNFFILVRLMNSFFIQYVISIINLWGCFFLHIQIVKQELLQQNSFVLLTSLHLCFDTSLVSLQFISDLLLTFPSSYLVLIPRGPGSF